MRRSTPRAVSAAAAVVATATLGLAGPAMAKSTVLTATMTGKVEVPAGDTNGSGSARLTVDAAKGKVCYTIKLKKVGTVVAGHIHKGPRGKAGGIEVELFAKPTKQPKGCVTGAKKSELRDIVEHPGRYYVNVHDKAFPAGAVRGQLHR